MGRFPENSICRHCLTAGRSNPPVSRQAHEKARTLSVMAGHRHSKNGVACARLCPAIHVFLSADAKDVDARNKAGHDELLNSTKNGAVSSP
jgi:hypothetical protein